MAAGERSLALFVAFTVEDEVALETNMVFLVAGVPTLQQTTVLCCFLFTAFVSAAFQFELFLSWQAAFDLFFAPARKFFHDSFFAGADIATLLFFGVDLVTVNLAQSFALVTASKSFLANM